LGLADDALHYLDLMKKLDSRSDDNADDTEATDTDTKDEEGHTGEANVETRTRTRVTRGRERDGAKQDLKGPDAVAYGLAIEACARAGRWREGLDLLQDMKQYTHAVSSNDNLNSKANNSNHMNDWRHDTNVAVPYTAAIDGCAEAGQWRTAIEVLHDMIHVDHVMPTVFTYSAVIHACAVAAGSPDLRDTVGERLVPMKAALAVLEQMKAPPSSQQESGSSSETDDDDNPDNNIYSLKQMILRLAPPKGSNVKPNIVTYNSAIQACAEGMSLPHAFQLMEELRKDHHNNHNHNTTLGQGQDQDLEPTLVTFGSLMTACERVGNVAAVGKVFQYMEDDYPLIAAQANEIIYGAALSCCRKAKEPVKAYRLFQKMLKSQIKPNAATCNTVLATLVDDVRPIVPVVVNTNNRDDDSVTGVDNDIDSTATGDNTSSQSSPLPLPKSLERAVLIFKAMEASPRYTSEQPNSMSSALLIKGYVQAHMPEDAERVLRQLKARLAPQHQRPRVELYTAVVTAYERTIRPLKALELMEEMRAEGYDFYNVQMFNSAFKRLLKLTNQLALGGGSGGGSTGDSGGQ
jgi:pentatricopeptide repeat protein